MTTSKILLVEDEMGIARWLETFIKKEGYEVLWASNGTDGLRMALREKPDLVLLDINLPEMDGYEVTAHLKKLDALAHIPIVAMTANVMKGDREKCLQAGMDDYVSKPISASKLFQAVEALVPAEADEQAPDANHTKP